MSKEISYIRTFFVSFIVGLTLLLGGSMFWNIHKEKQVAIDYARVEADANFNKDLSYRRWASMHGGVYVPVTEKSKPNPFLSFLGKRDIITTDSSNMTLVNPAYMTRQVFEIAEDQYGIKGHITSLNPIRPMNIADSWEVNVLERFAEGEMEYSSIEKIDGKDYLRYMKAMIVEQSCMKCHARQGYNVGDVRGGISVSVPMDQFYQIAQAKNTFSILWHLVIYISILLLMIFGYSRYLKELKVRITLHKQVSKSRANLLKQNHEYSILNTEFKAQNTELQKSILKAEESDRLKTAFIANLSHEIRTPMNGILGFADLLQDQNIPESSQKKFISIIKKSGERMLGLISDLVDISKIDSNQEVLHEKPVVLNDTLQKLHDTYINLTRQKGVELILQTALPTEKSWLIADGPKLEKIIDNLLSNALKFTTSGIISFGYAINDSNIIFNVTDTGRGIDPELIDHVFDRFRKGDEIYVKKEEDGSGLGLAICKSYVELMNGKIWVESEPGKGSSFRFTIPFKSANKVLIKDEPTHEEEKAYDGKKILIAEDDEVSYQYLQEILEPKHLEVIHANNGQDSINIFRKTPDINVILMDIKMPVMDGIAATREIRKENPHIPIIVQTAFESDSDKRKAFEAGCTEFISKPVKAKELFGKINAALK